MPADEINVRHSPLYRIYAWLLRMKVGPWESPEIPPLPEPPLSTWKDTFTTTVPCKGDAFTFHVSVSRIWARRGDLAELETTISAHTAMLNSKLERQLRDISRRYQPDGIREFERAAANEFSKPVGFSDDSALTCGFSVYAEPDNELREKLRDAEISRLQADAMREEEERQVAHLDRMRDLWLAFLKEADKDPLGSLAVQLAGNPGKVAELMAKHVSNREQAIDQLRKVCDTASQAYRDKGLYEFEISMDSPLRRLLRYVENTSEPHAPDTATANGAHPPGQTA
jgi:hypothetical protein